MVKNGIYGYYDIKKNQMVYIGQSKNISLRHSHHLNPIYYNNQTINRVLQNNMDRYKLVIIKSNPTFSKNDRDILEKHYIEFYNTFRDDNKFNYTPGGDFAQSTVPDIAKKISKSMSGQNNPNYGKKKPELSKRNSQNIGSKNPMYGKHHTKETIDKIRESKIGKKLSDETHKKMSLSQGNTTGYRRVSLKPCFSCKSGKIYSYRHYNDDGKRISIHSVNLKKLKEKALKAGFPWDQIR